MYNIFFIGIYQSNYISIIDMILKSVICKESQFASPLDGNTYPELDSPFFFCEKTVN
jgi:hypothetical protein